MTHAEVKEEKIIDYRYYHTIKRGEEWRRSSSGKKRRKVGCISPMGYALVLPDYVMYFICI